MGHPDRPSTQRPRSPLLEQIDDRLPQWLRDRLANEGEGEQLRQVLLTLYARIGEFWSFIPKAGIQWVGEAGAMTFSMADDTRLQAALKKAGYIDSFWATGDDDRWGLREPGTRAAGLHWRGKKTGEVNVHIDLNPPSGTGLKHWLEDKKRRANTHTPATLRAGVESRGIAIPVLSLQEWHGRLSVKLAELESTARGKLDRRANLDTARTRLDDAAAIIWTRSVVSDKQLADATAALADADRTLKQVRDIMSAQPPSSGRSR